MKIGVIDDDPIILDLLQVAFSELGYSMVSRTSAMGALGWIQNERPEIVLVDLNMPGLPGDEWLDMITKETTMGTDGRKPAFVIFSSRSHTELERVVRDTCAIGYIRKQDGVDGFSEAFKEIVQGFEL